MGRLSETGRRFLGQVRALHRVESPTAPASPPDEARTSEWAPSPAACFGVPYECGVCGRRLLTGEERGCFCIDGRRTITCSLCDIELAAAGFVRADEGNGSALDGSSALADCA
jgi:hypothetical protein